MPRHSGNRDGRPIGRIHGCTAGFLRRPRQEVILTAALFAQAECLQVAARSGQRHHRGTANECRGADAPRPHGRCAPSNEMSSRSLMGFSLQPNFGCEAINIRGDAYCASQQISAACVGCGSKSVIRRCRLDVRFARKRTWLSWPTSIDVSA
jgi:hypothetical protein